jgi:hypothetical protein
MTIHWYDMDPTLKMWVDAGNIFFTIIFLLEAFSKIIGLGFRYFLEGWNVFDFSIVIISIFSFIL